MKLFLFGNGNLSFDVFVDSYKQIIDRALKENFHFLDEISHQQEIIIKKPKKTSSKKTNLTKLKHKFNIKHLISKMKYEIKYLKFKWAMISIFKDIAKNLDPPVNISKMKNNFRNMFLL